MLNMAGRLVLAKATLCSIPSHVMSYIKISEGVTKSIDKIIRDFFWGFSTEKKKMHLLKCDTITKSRDLGGLGIHNTVVRNKIIISGLAWRLTQSPGNLWSSLLHRKYKSNTMITPGRQVVSRT